MRIPVEVASSEAGQKFWRGLAALWVFSAAISALSPPDQRSGRAYRWLFTFAHLLAANLDRISVFGSYFSVPGLRKNCQASSVEACDKG